MTRAVSVAVVMAACLLAAALFLLPGAETAQAQTTVKLVSNTGQATQSGTSFSTSYDRAAGFTTGSNSAGYVLKSVELDLSMTTETNTTDPTYTVSIYSDSSGSPGSSQGTLTNPASLSVGINSFTAADDGINLDADTTYYVVLEVTASGNRGVKWEATTSDNEDTGAATGWTIANANQRRTSGSSSWTTPDQIIAKLAIHGYANNAPTVANPPRFASGFGPLRLEPGAAMTPVMLPAATGGGGAPYTYSLTSEPAGLAGLAFDPNTRVLSGTPEAEGRWTLTYTAHDGDADTSAADAARLTFRVTVGVAFEEQQQVVKRTLAVVASRTAASALANIGTRLGDAVPAAGLALAGRPVSFGGSGA